MLKNDNKKRHIVIIGKGGGGGGTQVQSDWAQTDDTQPDYIKNKPEILDNTWFGTQAEFDALVGKDPDIIYYIEDTSVIPDYFYVEDISGSDNTLNITKSREDVPTIEVFKSTDGTNWESMGSTSTTAITATVPANGKLYLKATANAWGTGWDGNKITCSSNYNVGGNIMSLLNGDNFENTSFIGTSREFQNLFNGSTTLVNAKDVVFPNNTAYASYRSMFDGCTSLISVSAYSTSYDSTSFNSWLDGVSATGDFYNLGGATFETGASGIPEGWTEHTSL